LQVTYSGRRRPVGIAEVLMSSASSYPCFVFPFLL
jgi:hypothetical protein